MTDNDFVISLNFSFGSDIVFDVGYPNAKSDIMFYGKLVALEESDAKIELKARSEYFLAVLSIALPLLALAFRLLMKIGFPLFLIALLLFPLTIIGLLNLIKSEENRLLRIFKEHLNHFNEISKVLQ